MCMEEIQIILLLWVKCSINCLMTKGKKNETGKNLAYRYRLAWAFCHCAWENLVTQTSPMREGTIFINEIYLVMSCVITHAILSYSSWITNWLWTLFFFFHIERALGIAKVAPVIDMMSKVIRKYVWNSFMDMYGYVERILSSHENKLTLFNDALIGTACLKMTHVKIYNSASVVKSIPFKSQPITRAHRR